MRQLTDRTRIVSQGVGLCLAAALLVPPAPTRAAQAGGAPSWVPIGPQGGEMAVLAAAPGGVVYAGAFWGAGVVRSDDGGRHWGPPGRGLPASGVTAVAVVPGSPEIVYAGGQIFGPYLSTDGGATWLPASAGFPVTDAQPVVQAMAATAEGSAVYALDVSGDLYKTQSGGRSWARVLLPAVAGSIAADPQRPSTLYIGSATEGIYRTRDGGETWSLLGGGVLPATVGPPLVAIDPAAPGSLYAVLRTASGPPPLTISLRLFHSVDDGLSWVFHPIPLPDGTFPTSLAAEPGGKVILATPLQPAPAPLFESPDGGATWTAVPGEPNDLIQGLIAAPGEPATVYACGGLGVWLSSDGGDRWRPSSSGLSAQAIVTVRIGADAASTFLYASVLSVSSPQPLHLFRRETGGAFHLVGGSDYVVVGVDPVRPEIVYASLYDGSAHGLFKSFDGGVTWSALGFPQDGQIATFKIDPGSPSILYAGGSWIDPDGAACQLGKSTDGGRTWACLSDSLSPNYLLIDPVRTSDLYLLSGSGELYTSRDGGATWNPAAARGLPRGLAVSIVAIDPAHDRRLYAAVQVSDQTAAVYVSNDGAGRWTLLASGLTGPIDSLAVDPHQPLTLYAGVSDTNAAFRSTDGGRHWDRFDAGLPAGQFVGGFLFDRVQPSIVYTPTLGAGVYRLDTGQ